LFFPGVALKCCKFTIGMENDRGRIFILCLLILGCVFLYSLLKKQKQKQNKTKQKTGQ
jgi:preprotein translocase subunit YajC